MKPLSAYLAAISPLSVSERTVSNPPISGVSNDSRKIRPASIFVAIRGAKQDGHEHIAAALKAGAAAIVYSAPAVDSQLGGLNHIRVSDAYHAYANLVECFFDRPAQSFRLTGITGTNGKTTTAFILRQMLAASASRCGLISTVLYSSGDAVREADRTTPEAHELQELFAEMRAAHCSDVVMEVSSHGLDQHRTANARFAAAVFSNLSGDHLDYHKTMEAYYQAKRRLFTESLTENGAAVINIEDPYGRRLASELPEKLRLLSYGYAEDCAVRISGLSQSPAGLEFKLRLPSGSEATVKSGLIGEHNAFNLAAAAGAAAGLGMPDDAIFSGLCQPLNVPGRLERIPAARNISVFVDYAHTDDALHRVLMSLRKLATKRIITVFGCGGDRDKTKRPRMALAAAELSDLSVITSDNPRSEDPLAIIAEIERGLPAGAAHLSIADRRTAIEAALAEAQDSDIVLIAGKGHETYQELKGVKNHFDDREEAAAAIKQLGLQIPHN